MYCMMMYTQLRSVSCNNYHDDDDDLTHVSKQRMDMFCPVIFTVLLYFVLCMFRYCIL